MREPEVLGSRFFWKLYFAFAGLVLVTLAATGFLVHQQLRSSLLADAETRLYDMAISLVPFSRDVFERYERGVGGDRPGTFDAASQAQIAEMGERMDMRITFVAPDGVVVVDSDRDPREMDNHGDRPEIMASKTSAYGVSRRFSETLGQSLLYVAINVRDGDRDVGTVRTSIPLLELDARLAALRNTLALGAGLGMLIALAVGLFVARRITAPVTEITDAAEGLREGRYDLRIETRGDDEFSLLGGTINRLADELTHRIATLAGQRAQLGAMVAGLQDGVFAINEQDELILYNEAAGRFLDLREGLSGSALWETVAVPELASMCARARDSQVPAAGEIELTRADATYVLSARATSFEADGQHGVVVVLHDITNLRRLEQMRTEFVANVSHELKTPLTSIRGYVETLINGAIHDNENNLRFLSKIEEQVDRLTAMVSDVLSLARIEATGGTAEMATIDWRAVVRGVIERYREAGELKDHVCSVEISDEAVTIGADEESMTQVLDNLIDNAIKYTPAGGTITVRAYAHDGFAVLEVEDTGIGVSAADRERIFERFFRTDRARSRDTGGTGLGLAIVKHLAQGFGGEVRVTSELGRGSCFSVWTPSI